METREGVGLDGAGNRRQSSPGRRMPDTMDSDGLVRHIYRLEGILQGVGFRPTAYRLATHTRLGGWVQNRCGDVLLALEGSPEAIRDAVQRLLNHLPSGARVDRVTLIDVVPISPEDRSSFHILPSEGSSKPRLVMALDRAVCRTCLEEVYQPSDRRYGYPFTTCTSCGPRYTVARVLPFDRPRTSLSRFPLCEACRREYETPEDRRFHAQTLACPRCGPQVMLEDAAGRPVLGDPLRSARRALAHGAIVALQGIGGYALVIDARHRDACRRLRELKQRPHKPLALMARNVEAVRRQCRLPSEAERILRSPEAPIVVLDVQPEPEDVPLPRDILAPDTDTLGIMLPTSPLHALLLEPLAGDPTPPLDWLVMTSGNRRSEPIAIRREDAIERLRGCYDLMLSHDREILHRNDDALAAIQMGQPQIWRAGRGYAPLELVLPQRIASTVLAMGTDERNTITVAEEDRAWISPHIGDVDCPEGLDYLAAMAEEFPSFLSRHPQVVAVDLHPDLQATQAGQRLAARLRIPCVAVQHHHAHAVACLVEHGETTALALTWDGLGLGDDGTAWGAELLHVTLTSYRRLATFDPVPLPGGDAAVRDPRRQLLARWVAAGFSPSREWIQAVGLDDGTVENWTLLSRSPQYAPLTHAAGRLFDAFAVLLDLAPIPITYDGQAPVRLEAAARRAASSEGLDVPFDLRLEGGLLRVDWTPVFIHLADRRRITDRQGPWAYAFHTAVARAAEAMIRYGVEVTGETRVALSGGVFMNRLLTSLLVPRLEAMGMKVLLHRRTPPNDGSLSLGQAVVAGTMRS